MIILMISFKEYISAKELICPSIIIFVASRHIETVALLQSSCGMSGIDIYGKRMNV